MGSESLIQTMGSESMGSESLIRTMGSESLIYVVDAHPIKNSDPIVDRADARTLMTLLAVHRGADGDDEASGRRRQLCRPARALHDRPRGRHKLGDGATTGWISGDRSVVGEHPDTVWRRKNTCQWFRLALGSSRARSIGASLRPEPTVATGLRLAANTAIITLLRGGIAAAFGDNPLSILLNRSGFSGDSVI